MVAALGIVVANPKRDRLRLVAALQVAAAGIGRSPSDRPFNMSVTLELGAQFWPASSPVDGPNLRTCGRSLKSRFR